MKTKGIVLGEVCALAFLTTLASGAGGPSPAVYLKLEAENLNGFGKYKGKAPWTHRMVWHPQWSRGGDSSWWAASGAAEEAGAEVWLEIHVPRTDRYAV